MSLNWDTTNDVIKCEISAFGTIKLERKNSDIFLLVQDGSTRIQMDTQGYFYKALSVYGEYSVPDVIFRSKCVHYAL